MFGDERDRFARCIQGACAIFLALFAVGDAYIVITSFGFFYGFTGITLFCGAIYLCWRCARYAITGKSNINRDDF